jgi:hypothetical protein
MARVRSEAHAAREADARGVLKAMKHETLDEQIDRVARAMSSPRVDAPISWQVRSRMRESGTLLRPVVALAALAAVVLFAVVMFRPNESSSPVPVQANLPARELHVHAALSEGVRATLPERRSEIASASQLAATVSRGTFVAGPPSAAEGEATVAPLAVAELHVPELAAPGLVEIAPLDISAISVPELLSIQSMKE